MAYYAVPGVSIAIIDGDRIVWAEGFGVKKAGEAGKVDGSTLFQAASISKPIATIGVMKLVEKGELDLDADVNSKLKSWKVPESEFTAKEKVTLRRIMSHSAGLTVHGFGGFAKSEARPTLVQILDGVPPAKNSAVRVDRAPGEGFRYSGGGTTVEELLVADVTGENPPEFLNRTVLLPLGMKASTFTQPLPQARWADASAGHADDPAKAVDGDWHIYPMTFAAGLWTTPGDLCRVILEMQKAANSTQGDEAGPISPATAKAMLTQTAGSMGLGFALAGTGKDQRFSHNGGNDGFRATMEGTREGGKGFVIMTNSDSGVPLMMEIARSIRREFGWADTEQKVIKPFAMSDATMKRIVGAYALPAPGAKVVIFEKDGKLRLRTEGTPEPLDIRLVPVSAEEFVAPEMGFEIRAEMKGEEPASALIINGRRRERIAEGK